MLARSALYWRTARYLRPQQFAFQVLNRLRPYRFAPSPAAASPVRAVMGPVEFIAAPPAAGSDPWSFRFLNVTRSFADGSVDWTCAEMPRLWRYNLQYFDYLCAPVRSARAATASTSFDSPRSAVSVITS